MLFDSSILFEYEEEAFKRKLWYDNSQNNADNRYEMWLDYQLEIKSMSGDTRTNIEVIDVEEEEDYGF